MPSEMVYLNKVDHVFVEGFIGENFSQKLHSAIKRLRELEAKKPQGQLDVVGSFVDNHVGDFVDAFVEVEKQKIKKERELK